MQTKIQYRIVFTFMGKVQHGAWFDLGDGSNLQKDALTFAKNECDFSIETQRVVVE